MVTSFVSKLVTAITFKKVLLWSLAGVLLVIAYTAYERRADLFEATSFGQSTMSPGNPVGTIFVVGDTSKKKIEAFVKGEKNVVGFAVVSADVRLNVRNMVFFLADPTVSNPALLAPLSSIAHLPLFTKNEDNNRQMIKLINGEFTCAAYNTTLLSNVAPTSAREIVTICRASLPPYYGHFSGFVTVLLNTDPDIEELLRLKNGIEALATEIYFRDVIPTSKRVKP